MFMQYTEFALSVSSSVNMSNAYKYNHFSYDAQFKAQWWIVTSRKGYEGSNNNIIVVIFLKEKRRGPGVNENKVY